MLLRVEIIEENVRDSGPIRDERDGPSIGRPLGVDVQAGLPREHGHRPLLQIEHGDAPFGESQVGEAGAVASITREGDHRAVG